MLPIMITTNTTPPEWQTAVTGLQDRLLENISIIDAMGVAVQAFDGRSLTLSAPLAKNYNDKGTGFAGSIASLSALSGWALLTLLQEQRFSDEYGRPETAIFHCDLRYDAPVEGDFTAAAEAADGADFEQFLSTLAERGRAKISISGQVIEGGRIKARLTAKYFARLPLLDERAKEQRNSAGTPKNTTDKNAEKPPVSPNE